MPTNRIGSTSPASSGNQGEPGSGPPVVATLNFFGVVKQDGHSFAFILPDPLRQQDYEALFRAMGKLAVNSELSFTWADMGMIAEQVRECME